MGGGVVSQPSPTKGALAPTLRYTALQGSYWACYCCIMTFSSVYLLARDFTNAQIGVLISVAGILSAVLQPTVSRVADGLKRLSLRQFCALLVAFQLAAGGRAAGPGGLGQPGGALWPAAGFDPADYAPVLSPGGWPASTGASP